MNKYEKWYNQITQRGKKFRELGRERHHILPQCMGGGDEIENITFITSREHFICHWLLTKIYPTGEEHWQMINALRIMRAENQNQTRYKTKITSRVYAKLKEEYSSLQSERYTGENNPFYGKSHTEEAKKRISQANSGDNNPAKRPEVGKKISEAKTGVKRDPFSKEWRQNLSIAKSGENNNMYGKKHSAETIQKISEKAKLRKNSPESNAKRSAALLGGKREKLLCPHCQQSVAVNGYARWHGDNCKQNKNRVIDVQKDAMRLINQPRRKR